MTSQPAASGIRERRSSERRLVPGSALIPVDIDEESAGFVFDISDEGASVHALSRMAPGSIHRLCWKFPGEESTIEVRGRVIWTDRINLSGLQFADLTLEVQHHLRQWLRECDVRNTAALALNEDNVDTADDTVVADLEVGSLLHRAQALTQADGAVVAVRSGDRWVCVASVGTAPERGGLPLSDAVVYEECVSTGQPVHCANTTHIQVRKLAEGSAGSAVLMPVPYGEQGAVIECLWAQQHSCDEPAVAILSVVAELMSIALRSYEVDLPKTVLQEPLPERDVRAVPSIIEKGIATVEQTALLQASLGSTRARARGGSVHESPRRRMLDPAGLNRFLLLLLVAAVALAFGWWYRGQNWNLLQSGYELPAAGSIPALRAPVRPALAEMEAVAHQRKTANPAVLIHGAKASTTVPPANPSGPPVSAPPSTAGNVLQSDVKSVEKPPIKRTTTEVAVPSLAFIPQPGARSSLSDLVGQIATTSPSVTPTTRRISTLSPPIPLNKVQPEYPAMARSMHRYGEVVLDVTVSKEGKVQDIVVVSGDPVLAAAAAKAMPLWHYKPAQLNGEAIEGRVRVTFNFTTPGAR